MSVDHGHRKKFCRLLKDHFPGTQFIITTHEKVWAKQMETEGLVGSRRCVAFQSWTVEAGPVVAQAREVWEEIEEDLARDDVPSAAGRLRRHVEYISGELADLLGAKVRYRGDLSYDLGDLFSAVVGRHGELLKVAAAAAQGWRDQNAEERVAALKQARSDALTAHNSEAWVLNRAIHWNEWATFLPAEFRSVAAAFDAVLGQLRCANPECESLLYVMPRAGDPETLRCRCATLNINLLRR